MRKRTIATVAIALAAVVGVGGLAAIGLGGSGETAVTYRTVPATVAVVEQTAAATGTLAPVTRYSLAFGQTPVPIAPSAAASASATTATAASTPSSAAGPSPVAGSSQAQATVTWPVTEVRVQVGQVVRAGQVLAVADDTSAAFAVDIAEQDLKGARRSLKDAEAGGSATTRKNAKTQVTQAGAQLRQARVRRADTAAQNANAVNTAEQVLADARQAYADDKEAGAAEPILEQRRAAIEQAKRSLSAARLQARASNNQAAAQVENASLAVTAAKRSYSTATATPGDSTLAALRVAVNDAEQQLKDAQEALDAATIRAPIDGRVTAVYAVAGADSTGPAISLESLHLEVRVPIDETDIGRVAVGQPATVTVTPLGEEVSGTVARVDPTPITSPTAVTRYLVTVTLEPATARTAGTSAIAASGAALPGMSAEITVVTDRAPDALAIPAAALSGTGGNYTVRVLSEDGLVSTRTVEVGLVTGELAQVTAGLEAGDAVITGTSTDLDDSDASGGFGPPGGAPGGFGGEQP